MISASLYVCGVPTAAIPPQFAAALASLRNPKVRSDIHLTEIPGPNRIAPFTIALEGTLVSPGPDELDEPDDAAQGRFVVLHNPAGETAWQGEFRIVTMVSAELDAEFADDPLLAEVAWSWLTDLLYAADLTVNALSGTVTRVLSTSFGLDSANAAELEIRASWTPTDPDLAPHLQVWADLMATAGGAAIAPPGYPPTDPVPEGVTPIRSHRHPRNQH